MRSESDGVFTTNVDWFGTLRARFGYVADRFLVYGTGGLAYGSVETNYSYAFEGASPARRDLLSGGVSETSWGWTVGAGTEYALNEHWSLKGEYLYVNLGGGGGSMTNSNGHGFVSETDDFDFHTVRLGVNYHF
jgi:outer membrane immunogenic protein